MSDGALLAGVELGGTKCICILGSGPDGVIDQVRVPTTEPEETLGNIEAVLARWQEQGYRFRRLGVASFGPIGIDRARPSYGFITSTAKPGWLDTEVAGRLERRFNMPVAFDTDVNGAALAEGRWGAAKGLNSFAYVTVGTGVGVGLIVNGQPLAGFTHAEIGHIRLARHPADQWAGSCPYHGDCVEGLASGSSIEARLGVPPSGLSEYHPAWAFVSHALSQLLHTLVLTAAPRRIILGGGVIMAQQFLVERIKRDLSVSLNGYVQSQELQGGIDDYIVLPALGEQAGPLGALALLAGQNDADEALKDNVTTLAQGLPAAMAPPGKRLLSR